MCFPSRIKILPNTHRYIISWNALIPNSEVERWFFGVRGPYFRPCLLRWPADRRVKIWVADESRFGLHTQSRRCWALRGQRVALAREQRYEWE